MYCDYFGFKKEPFSIAPDPAFLYPSSQHRQALAHLKYGLEREGGFILLTGEVGTGKTTLTRLLLEQISPTFRVAYVLNAKLDTKDVLASICDELHIDLDQGSSDSSLRRESNNLSPKFYIDLINENLLAAHSKGLKTLVVIEEAQNLDEEVLETLRLLTNLETNTSKLLHILLVGQPELLEVINRQQLRQLNQRVISRFHIHPLNPSETEQYIKHRLQKVGCSRKVFNKTALGALFKFSEGIPRKLNLIAERALLGAYAENRDFVSKAQVLSANREVFGTPSSKNLFMGRLYWTATLVVCLVSVLVFTMLQTGDPKTSDPSNPSLNNTAAQADTIQSDQIRIQSSVATASEIREQDTNLDMQLSSTVDESTTTAEVAGEAISEATDFLEDLDSVSVNPEINSSLRNPNAFTKMLRTWNLDAQAEDPTELCLAAASNNLRCEELEVNSVAEFDRIDRPLLLSTSQQASDVSNEYLLLRKANDSTYILQGEGEDYWLSAQELEEQMTGSVLYLWSPPLGYIDSVRLGDSNRLVVGWLQPLLGDINPDIENLITGGRYTQPLSDAVAEFQRQNGLVDDGILGRQTIIKLNQINEGYPPLAMTPSPPLSATDSEY